MHFHDFAPINVNVRGSFKKFYHLPHNFVNIKDSCMKCAIIEAIHIQSIQFSKCFTFFAGVVILKHRFWTTETVKTHNYFNIWVPIYDFDTMKNIFQWS